MITKPHIKDQVDIITVHYNAKEILPQFFESIKNITYKKHKLYLFENGSNDGSFEWMQENEPKVTVFRSDKNLFFCESNNYAVNQSNGEFILLINNDIVVEPDFLDHMVNRIKSDDNTAAVASKMMLFYNPTILDSTGTLLLDNGEAFNRGIGQVDIGQYDAEKNTELQTFGACFGCALIRRSCWEGIVGELDKDYFGYYDDTDWNFRANLMGYNIVFEPKAKVYHAHSITARKNAEKKEWKATRKHFLIMRNFIWTAQKNFQGWQAFKITLVRYKNLIKEAWNFKSWSYLKNNLSVIWATLISLPKTLRKRKRIQGFRRVADSEITKYAPGQMSFFDGFKYKPIYSLDNLEFTFKKMKDRQGDYYVFYERIRGLNNTKDPDDEKWVEKTKELLEDLKKYIDPKELDEFKNYILEEKIWFMPSSGL